MSDDKNKVLKALHDLVATCNDASEGFAKAAKGVGDQDLGNWLAQVSKDRDGFATALNAVIGDLGGEPRNDLHEGGILHRGWVDLKQSLRSKDDFEIARECIAGESGSLNHYDNALAQDLKPDVRSTIIEQRTTIQDDLLYLDGKATRHKSHRA